MALGLDSRQFERGLGNAGRSLAGFATKIVAAVGAIAGLNKAVQAGRSVEDLRIRLNFLAGDAERGARALDLAREAATKLPFSLDEIANGLSSIVPISDTFGDLENNLQAVADIATIAGLDFQTTALQMQRAFSAGAGAADLFRERGVLAMAGFEAGVSYSVEETQRKLLEFAAANKGAADQLNTTLTGALSQLSDRLFNLNTAFAEAFNPRITASINAIIERFDASSSSIGELAAQLGENLFNSIRGLLIGFAALADIMTPVFNVAIKGVNNIVKFFNALPPELKALGLLGFMMLGGRGKLLVGLIIGAFDFIVEIANKALNMIENVANGAIDILNGAIEQVNRIPGVDIDLINNVDYGELTPEKVKDKLSSIMDFFTDDTQIAAIGPLEGAVRNVMALVDEAMAQTEQAKKVAQETAGVITDDTTLGKSEETNQKSSSQEFTDGWANATDNFKKNVTDMTNFGENLFGKMSNSFTDSIMNFVETGKLSFKDLFRTLITEFVKLQANKMFLALFGGGPSAVGGGTTGLLQKGLGMLGFRADGGPVGANKPYIVGERGPELFMPRGSGTIIPNEAMGMGAGGGTTNVTYNINATDARSFQQLLARDPEFLYAVTQQGARRQPR
jgi:hypothetical protein